MIDESLLNLLLPTAKDRAAHTEQVPALRLGAAINRVRNGRGVSQRKLAAAAGITQRQVSLVENGSPVTTATLLKIVAALQAELVLRPVMSVTASPTGADLGISGGRMITIDRVAADATERGAPLVLPIAGGI